MYGGLRLLQANGNVNRAVREEVFHWKSCGLYFAPESWPFDVKDFLPTVFQHSIRELQASIFSTPFLSLQTLLSQGKSDEYIISFLGTEAVRKKE